jgi:anthranilate phosphoribosyltransferase
MQELIKHLQSGSPLSAKQIAGAAAFLVDPNPEPAAKTPVEIAGFVEEFLRLAVDPQIDRASLPGPMLDVVGTGGDKLHLFNVSTTAMFILAAGGVCMVKHGNRGITSKAGGADVLEALGIKIDLPPDRVAECVQRLGVGFLFAPLYHPAFAAVKEARALLAQEGSRSIFNILGPLLNPARPDHQLIGVFEPGLTTVFADILQRLDRKAAWIVHGHTNDGRGMDELSTLGPNEVVQLKDGTITRPTISWTSPHPATVEDLVGGDAAVNADILEGILAGRIRGAKRDMALMNSAAGFVVTGLAKNLSDGWAHAEDVLNRGAAHVKLRAMQDFV